MLTKTWPTMRTSDQSVVEVATLKAGALPEVTLALLGTLTEWTLGCQRLSWTWSRPRWLTLGMGAIKKWNHETISIWLVQGSVVVDALRSIGAGVTWWCCCDILCDISWWCCDISFIIPAASTQSDNLAFDFAQPQFMDSFSWIHDLNAILVLKPPRLKNFSPTKLWWPKWVSWRI